VKLVNRSFQIKLFPEVPIAIEIKVKFSKMVIYTKCVHGGIEEIGGENLTN
jgi:hypothetical protein